MITNIKEGDVVVCIKPIGTILAGNKYIIDKLFIGADNYYRCHLKGIKDNGGIFLHRFVLELEYNTNKYNI